MLTQALVEKLSSLKIVPVVALENAEAAAPLADALTAGGLPCMEITFRTAAAAGAIRAVRKRDELLLGAGTVLSVETVKEAIDAGAEFIVSPGLNPQVVDYCLQQNIPIIPGVATPTDIEVALGFGLTVVKFFPAEAFGGLKTLKAISAPYGQLRFMPTGGINPENLGSYLAFEKVLACGGSWMVKPELIRKGDFATVTSLTRDALAAVSHV